MQVIAKVVRGLQQDPRRRLEDQAGSHQRWIHEHLDHQTRVFLQRTRYENSVTSLLVRLYFQFWPFSTRIVSNVGSLQCDQIGRFIAPWATFQSLWQQLFCPNCPYILGNFCKGIKMFHFSSEINFGQLYRTLLTFFWSRCSWTSCI